MTPSPSHQHSSSDESVMTEHVLVAKSQEIGASQLRVRDPVVLAHPLPAEVRHKLLPGSWWNKGM